MGFWSRLSGSTPKAKKAVVVKVNVGSVSTEEIPSYMESAQEKLTEKRLKEQGFIYYFVPVRDEPTSIMFVDLETMKHAKV